ncbi:hypothetical protein BJI69_03935 [Luteibacter rhizovicinus DSM 16549]|uniref:Uncharacterized protein n=1 Tax=Luteibacter rhizovicinus DSM 16549 TaxID=1440763 RepID=A0A0G9HBI8_9GAMM|nr:hypothetical protein BJI69_03935 [Luteibacter rhizovicinus DSM 16549]KLD66609.1 hypothetical protein Y883_12725 [Luteibacter rhizovicinus DSM 16549]KLD79352.1 hypothetical protein Y886_04955 [Xanthomonas hyacinthi DSM 19077]
MGVTLLLGLPGGAPHAQSSSVGGVLAISNQLVDRGLAVTPKTPVLQGALSWTTPSGWSLGLSASTETRSPGRVVEALAQAAYAWSLSTNWQMQTSLLYYRYGNDSHWRNYDRVELGANWIYRDVLTLGISEARLIHTGGRGPRGAADIGFRWPIALHLSVSAGIGTAQYLIPPYYRDYPRYQYGHAGLVWENDGWRVELNHFITEHAPRPRGSPAVSPWNATVSRTF